MFKRLFILSVILQAFCSFCNPLQAEDGQCVIFGKSYKSESFSFASMKGQKAFAVSGSKALTYKCSKKTDKFDFSILFKSPWYMGDTREHKILAFKCTDNDGKAVTISLGLYPSGSLVFASNDGKWMGGVVTSESMIWAKDKWQFVSGGFTPEKGLFLKINDFKERRVKVTKLTGISELKEVIIRGDNPKIWFRKLYINSKPDNSVYQPEADILLNPNGPWCAGKNMFIQCSGLLHRTVQEASGMPGSIFIDCPDGIIPSMVMALNYNAKTITRDKGKKVSVNGKEYTRYLYPLAKYEYKGKLLKRMNRNFTICLNSSLDNNSISDVKIGILKDSGQLDFSTVVSVKTINVPKVQAFKKFIVGMSITKAQIKVQSDLDLFYHRLGLKFLDVWEYSYWIGRRNKKIINEAIQLTKRFNKSGITPVFSAHRAIWEYIPKQFMAVDKNGKTYTRRNSRCPSDRGERHDFDMGSIKTFADMGAGISLDIEASGLNVRHPCYCANCTANFKKYLVEKYPKIKYIDPKIIEKDKSKYKNLKNIWNDFVGIQVSKMIYKLYNAEAKSIKQAKVKPAEKLMILYDEGLSSSGCDLSWLDNAPKNNVKLFMGPPLYHLPVANYKNLRKYVKKFPKANIMPYLGCSFDRYEVDIRSQVFVMFGGGAKGIIFWYWPLFSGQELVWMAEALNAVAEVEDILYNGEETVAPVFNSEHAYGNIIRKGNQAVLLVGGVGRNGSQINVKLPFEIKGCLNLLNKKQLISTGLTSKLNLDIEKGTFRIFKLDIK